MSETKIHEIAEGIYRIHTPVSAVPGGFSFNQYLLAVPGGDALLFHTGPRGLFAEVLGAMKRVIDLERLRYVGFSHVESDECGSLNQILAVAPRAEPVCSRVAAMVQVTDLADRAPVALEDGERLQLGPLSFVWIDAPHVPHGWECGYLFEETTRTLLCGDLFTQPGLGIEAVTAGDIVGPSEAFRHQMDYFAHAPHTTRVLERLASLQPDLLACMHGSAYRGDAAATIRALSSALG